MKYDDVYANCNQKKTRSKLINQRRIHNLKQATQNAHDFASLKERCAIKPQIPFADASKVDLITDTV